MNILNNLTEKISKNWKSGLTVSLISIPLSISLAVASGASPSAGIITAVWAGLLASIFGGSNYNIVGPAGALSGVLLAFSLTHGAQFLPLLALLSGIIIAIAYVFSLDNYLKLVPGTIMQGFSLGVAVLIAFGQLGYALGISGLPKHKDLIGNVYEILKNINLASLEAIIFTVLSIGFLFLCVKLVPKIPGAIFLMPLGIGIGILQNKGIIGTHMMLLSDKFTETSVSLFTMPAFTWNSALIIPSLAVSFIAILETLISARIADSMTKTSFDTKKEMIGLSLANIASGLFGGIPATGVFMRTGLNVKSGATDKISGTINAICVGLISLFLWKYFMFAPFPIIAGILLFISIRMIEVKELTHLYYHAKPAFTFAILTAVTMVFVDTVVGLLLGMLLASFYVLKKLSYGNFELILNDKDNAMKNIVHSDDEFATLDVHADVCVYSIKGEFAYYNKESHTKRILEEYVNYKSLVLRFRDLAYIDVEGIEALGEIIKKVEKEGKRIYISSLNASMVELLEKTSPEFRHLKKEHRVYRKTSHIIKYLGITPKHIVEHV